MRLGVKNRIWFFLVSIFIVVSCVPNDPDSPTPDEVFIKYYGGVGEQEITDLKQTPDGGFLIFGSQKLNINDRKSDYYLVRTDFQGNLLNTRTYDFMDRVSEEETDSTEETAGKIRVLDNGQIILVGSSQFVTGVELQESFIFVLLLDENLEVLNRDSLRLAGTDLDLIGTDILQDQDGNFVLVGSTDQKESADFTTAPSRKQIFLAKIAANSDGTFDKLLRKSWGFPNSDDEAVAISEMTNGDLVIISSTDRIGRFLGTGKNVMMTVFSNLTTSPRAQNIYGFRLDNSQTTNDIPSNVIETPFGYVITGTSTAGTNSLPFILGLDHNANTFSDSTLFGLVENAYGIPATGVGITRLLNNQYAIVGSYPNFTITGDNDVILSAKSGEIMFIRTDQSGHSQPSFSRHYGLEAGDDVGNCIITLADGSLAMGATLDYGSGVTLMALMKINNRGELKR